MKKKSCCRRTHRKRYSSKKDGKITQKKDENRGCSTLVKASFTNAVSKLMKFKKQQ